MRGKTVDMDLLRKRNELTPAVGNARVNARGDELGPGGKIIKKRDEVVQDHYAQASKAVESSGRAKVAVKSVTATTVAPVAEPAKKTVTRTKKEEVAIEEQLTPAEKEMLNEADAWTEDADGNFVPKGV